MSETPEIGATGEGARGPRGARRSVFVLCAALGLLFLLGTMGAALALVTSLGSRAGSPSPAPGNVGIQGKASGAGAATVEPLPEMREFQPRATTPEPAQLALSFAVALGGAVLGLGGFILRRRRFGLYLQRGFGILLLANLLYFPFSLAAPIVWPAALLLGLAGAGLWVLLVTLHPAARPQ